MQVFSHRDKTCSTYKRSNCKNTLGVSVSCKLTSYTLNFVLLTHELYVMTKLTILYYFLSIVIDRNWSHALQWLNVKWFFFFLINWSCEVHVTSFYQLQLTKNNTKWVNFVIIDSSRDNTKLKVRRVSLQLIQTPRSVFAIWLI